MSVLMVVDGVTPYTCATYDRVYDDCRCATEKMSPIGGAKLLSAAASLLISLHNHHPTTPQHTLHNMNGTIPSYYVIPWNRKRRNEMFAPISSLSIYL